MFDFEVVLEDFKAACKRSPDSRVSSLYETANTGDLKIAYQPIVDLCDRQVFAYEALARTSGQFFKSPPEMFDMAIQCGVVGELGRLLRTLSLVGCADHPLFINIHPHEFDQRWLIQPDDPIFWHSEQVYIEITESVPLHYFRQCHSVLAEARGKGVMLAVDDLGSGYSNLKYISDLVPEVVKLDRMLIAGMRTGDRQWRLVRGIVKLCEEMGAKVIAEGIEYPEELRAVIEAGAHFGQGYLLARPAYEPVEANWPDSIETRKSA